VIEEKFGFNRQTFALWLKDEIRGLSISLVLIIPLSYAILYFMQLTGSWWWLYVWITLFLVGMTLSKLYPIWIAPLFNKFTPLPAGPLRNSLEELSQRASFPIENIYIIDASIRTTHPNAYFAGLGKTKRLVLFDSLVKDFSQDEIATVVAHEIGHDHHKHLWKSLAISQTVSLLFFYCLSLVLSSPYLYQTFLISHYPSNYMGLVLLSLVSSVVLAYLSPIFNWLSWKFEAQADQYAYHKVSNKEAIKTMLIKLAEKSLDNLTPHPLYARFHYSHPPMLQRLQYLGLDK
jgi:STE24 endopeptidase